MSDETIEVLRVILDEVDIIGEPPELVYTYTEESLARAAKILDDYITSRSAAPSGREETT
jgi:hypothetical protein